MMGLAVLAVAALSVISVASPLQQADAAKPLNRNEATNTAEENLVNVQANVQANVPVDVENNNICVIADTCTTDD